MKNSDRILAISAIFVSACALAVSVYQTQMLSMEKDAAVWPYIRIGTSWHSDRFVLDVSNDGIGPALIQEVTYEFKDSTFYRIHELIPILIQQDTFLKATLKNFIYANIEDYGTAMKAGESTNILDIQHESKEVIKRLQHYIYVEEIKIKIDYCSVYQKCWRNQDNKIVEL